jgi:hypothetical protein
MASQMTEQKKFCQWIVDGTVCGINFGRFIPYSVPYFSPFPYLILLLSDLKFQIVELNKFKVLEGGGVRGSRV